MKDLSELGIGDGENNGGQHLLMTVDDLLHMLRIDILSTTYHHIVGTSPIEVIPFRIGIHQIARILPPAFQTYRGPVGANPQRTHAMSILVLHLTGHPTNGPAYRHLFISQQVVGRGYHKESRLRGAIEVIEHLPQVGRCRVDPFPVEAVTATNDTFHRLHRVGSATHLPQSGKHRRYHG